VTPAQGETAVTTSALIVSGLYGYRKTTEKITKAPTVRTGPFKAGIESYVKAPLGYGELAPLGAWATGMGLTFILLSVATSINATFGGSFAILVTVGAVLGNGQEVLKDLGQGLGGAGSSEATAEPSGEKKQQLQPMEAVASNHPPVK
jgi:hypothetical protein